MTLHIVVPGQAEPQGSKRAFVPKGGTRPVLVEDNKRLRSWRMDVRAMMGRACHDAGVEGIPFPQGVPVAVTMVMYVSRPQGHYGSGKNARSLKPSAPAIPATGFDCDKCARSLGDAGTGVFWHDDRQIAEWHVFRRYAEDGRVRTAVWAKVATLK